MFSLNSLDLIPSRTLSYFYIGVHLLCIYSVYYTPLPILSKVVLSLIVSISFTFNYKAYISLRSPLSIISLSWNADERVMSLRQLNGVKLEVVALRQAIVLPYAVCLLCEVEERFFYLPILVIKDACNKNAFRRLRVLALHSSVTENRS